MTKQGSNLDMPTVRTISKRAANYPLALRERLGKAAPQKLDVLGDASTLLLSAVGFVCSVKCPGSVVIHTFDAIRELRDAGVVVVGGFHSPMEQECLDFLLRGRQPVIMSPAKGINPSRLSRAKRFAIDDGRLTLVSIYPEDVTRTNKNQSQARNEMIAALAKVVLIPHASPGGNAETIASQVIGRKQTLLTIKDSENDNLNQLGAEPYRLDRVVANLA